MENSLVKHLKRNICIGVVNTFLKGTHFYSIKRNLLRIGGIQVARNVRVVAPIFVTADLTIGENTFIGREFSVYGNGSVAIGKNCDFGPAVSVLTGSHEIGDANHRAGNGKSYHITFEDGSWIGARSTFLGDISVKKGAVIASGAVVINEVAENTLVGGVPAKMIKELDK